MNKTLHIRSKIWIEDDRNRVVFGQGRLKILESIERNGSISAAARELRMSYRAVWGKSCCLEMWVDLPVVVHH